MPPRVPRGASPPPRTKESLVHGRAQTSGVIIVALTQVLNPRHTRNRGARARCHGASARRSRTHTAMRSRGDRRLRSSLRLPLRPLAPSSSGPMAPAPHKTVRHSLRRAVWCTHKDTAPRANPHPPPGRPTRARGGLRCTSQRTHSPAAPLASGIRHSSRRAVRHTQHHPLLPLPFRRSKASSASILPTGARLHTAAPPPSPWGKPLTTISC